MELEFMLFTLDIDQLLPIFIRVVIMFIIVLLFICYMVSFICSCSYYDLCTLFLLHELFPLLHTHSLWSRSDDPGFARPAIGRLSYCAGVR